MNRTFRAAALGLLALGGAGLLVHQLVRARGDVAVQPATATPTLTAEAPDAFTTGAPVSPPAINDATETQPAGVVFDAAMPVRERIVYRNRVVYRTRAPRYYVHRRSKRHSVEIIGGSTLGGAGLGAIIGGQKGAVIGGLVGGTAGTVYDRKTHKRVVRRY